MSLLRVLIIIFALFLVIWNSPPEPKVYQPISSELKRLVRYHGTTVIEDEEGLYIVRKGKKIRL